MPAARSAAAALVAAGTVTAAYATLLERQWYALRHVTVPVLRPTAERPLRILHLSDLHLLSGQTRVAAFVRRCFELRPDMVVATGDLLGHPDALDAAVATLALPDGVPGLAVLGSNDFYAPVPKNPLRYLVGPSEPTKRRGRRVDTARLVQGLEDVGWTFVDNRRTSLPTPAGPIDVAGLSDPHIGRDHPERVTWTPPTEPVALRLGVVHAPYLRVLDLFADHGFDLVLAGHTHGGQVRVPGVGALVANCDLPLDKARGLSRHRSSPGHPGPWLHVSAGLGTSKYAPVRFACRPEASMLDLVGPAAD